MLCLNIQKLLKNQAAKKAPAKKAPAAKAPAKAVAAKEAKPVVKKSNNC